MPGLAALLFQTRTVRLVHSNSLLDVQGFFFPFFVCYIVHSPWFRWQMVYTQIYNVHIVVRDGILLGLLIPHVVLFQSKFHDRDYLFCRRDVVPRGCELPCFNSTHAFFAQTISLFFFLLSSHLPILPRLYHVLFRTLFMIWLL